MPSADSDAAFWSKVPKGPADFETWKSNYEDRKNQPPPNVASVVVQPEVSPPYWKRGGRQYWEHVSQKNAVAKEKRLKRKSKQKKLQEAQSKENVERLLAQRSQSLGANVTQRSLLRTGPVERLQLENEVKKFIDDVEEALGKE